MNSVDLISTYYRPGSKAHTLLVAHGRQVADKALAVVANIPGSDLDSVFIEQAAMLHDIGIFLTDSPALGCCGKHPYICHGFLGHDLLVKSGMPAHALVCERHVGVGISKMDIQSQRLPLPRRDMVPVSLAETVICYADKFFSKNGSGPPREKSIDEITKGLEKIGVKHAEIFLSWHRMFS